MKRQAQRQAARRLERSMRRAAAGRCERCQLNHLTPEEGELPRTCDREINGQLCGGRVRPLEVA